MTHTLANAFLFGVVIGQITTTYTHIHTIMDIGLLIEYTHRPSNGNNNGNGPNIINTD